jgi:2-hydroxychromene-2-carboxylate isomerase
MAKTVEFFFDFGSPTSYLAYTQISRLAADCGAEVTWRPMLLGGVFKATGNASPVTVPAKGRWMFADMARWAQRYGVALAANPFFPVNTLTLMRIASGLQVARPQDFPKYCEAVFGAMWRLQKNVGDATILSATLAEAGLDAPALLELAAQPEVKARLIATTDEAIARGVFGAPTFFVGHQMFFGQDRLEFVREALH